MASNTEFLIAVKPQRRPLSAPPIHDGCCLQCPVSAEPQFSKPIQMVTPRPAPRDVTHLLKPQVQQPVLPRPFSAERGDTQLLNNQVTLLPRTPRAQSPQRQMPPTQIVSENLDVPASDVRPLRSRPLGVNAALCAMPYIKSRANEHKPHDKENAPLSRNQFSSKPAVEEWKGKCGWREVGAFRPPAPCGKYVGLAQRRPLSARDSISNARLHHAQELLYDRYHSHKSNIVFEGFRKMSYNVEGQDPRARHVYPADIANLMGELGAQMTKEETAQLLAKVRPQRAENDIVGIRTFTELVTGRKGSRPREEGRR